MAYFVFWPDSKEIERHGFGRVAHVPCIYDSTWKYHRESSTYLIERATCSWPVLDSCDVKRYPTKKSLQRFADSLVNFLEWVEFHSLDWRKITYTDHIYDRYQREMLNGKWSVSGTSLSSETVNRRVEEACSFLKWATKRGLRENFTMLTEKISRRDDVATNSHGHRPREVEARIGRVRPDPKTLRLPTDKEIGRWLDAVKIQRGYTKALMCRLVLATGVRREEAACWRVNTLPEAIEDWEILGDQVKVLIKYGCKGQDYGENNGDKIGPARYIWMPLSLAEEIHSYRRGPRLAARAKWVRTAQTKQEQRVRISHPSPHLFLSESEGIRITAKSLYEAWTSVAHLPFPGWSVHGGRHWWACKVLLREHQKRIALMGSDLGVPPLNWISGNVQNDIQLLIRPQLGHIDKATSERYVNWVTKILEFDGLQTAYQDLLDEIERNESDI